MRVLGVRIDDETEEQTQLSIIGKGGASPLHLRFRGTLRNFGGVAASRLVAYNPRMTDDNRHRRFFFEAQKRNFSSCLPPTLRCGEKPIRSHSIQNKRVLDLVHTDHHVMMPRYLIKDEKPTLTLQRVGRNEATTFTGLCSKHDTELFAAIDTKPLDTNDDEQLTQLAYRSVMREMFTLTEEAARLWWMHDAWVKGGLAAENDFTAPLVAGTALYAKAQKVFSYRSKHFDTPRLQGKKADLVHSVLELPNTPPVLAASCFFSTGTDAQGKLVGPTFNVVPMEGNRVAILLSCPKAQEAQVRPALKAVCEAADDRLKQEISRLILRRVENFVLSPAHYSTWLEPKRKRILDAFERTMDVSKDIEDHPDLMLF